MTQAFFAMLLVVGLEAAEPALRAVAEATFKQTGAEAAVDHYGRSLQLRYLSPQAQWVLGNGLVLGKSLIEQRITFQFTID